MKLQDNPQFQEDYKKYQKEISLITDDRMKKDLTDLLIEFSRQVAAIDQQHTQLFFSNKLPTDISETRLRLSECKRKIETGIQSWKRNNRSS
jgi:hypothetical protein